MQLTEIDLYAISRAIIDQDWRQFQISNPLLKALLENTTAKTGPNLLRMLGPEVSAAVLAIDPNEAPPVISQATRHDPTDDVPDLPASARLTPAQEREARETGGLLDIYLDWAGRSANQTPMLFHLWAAIFMCGVAIARRLYVHSPWQQKVFPNIYAMNVAISTYYRKSAGMSLAESIMRKVIPHLIMPNPGSSEGLITLLSGRPPADFADMAGKKRDLVIKGMSFAACRAIMREELSGLFKAMGSDYMRGMKEYLMQAYDCPDYLEFFTNSKGLIIVQHVGLSLIGVTTPAELANSISINDWYNGHLARFALLTPEPDYKERPALTAPLSSTTIEDRLRALYELLPAPPALDALNGDDPPVMESWSLVCKCWDLCHAYAEALRQMTAPDSTLDDRLRAIYGRLHVLALKVAIILAALDWSILGDRATKPIIEHRHWYRAQIITEEVRASCHRLLAQLNRNTDSLVEEKIGSLLARNPMGLTVRDLVRHTGFSRKAINEAIEALADAGAIYREERKNAHGPSTHVYKLANESTVIDKLR
jgi:predicted transcriptional regulator